MNDYRSAMDDFDKKIAHSQTTAGVGTIPIEVVEAAPNITGYNEKVNVSGVIISCQDLLRAFNELFHSITTIIL